MKNSFVVKDSIKTAAYNLSTLWILLAITVFFGIFGNNFLKGGNISNIINQAGFLAIIGVSQLVVILTGGINLSIGSCMALSTVLLGPLMLAKAEMPFALIFVMVVVCGGLIGIINGFMVTLLNIPAFLATFATMYVARGAAWLYIGKGVYYGINENIRFFATGVLFRIGTFRVTMPMVLAAVFLAGMAFFITKSNIGRKIYFTGSNPEAARFSGIPTQRIVIFAHILSGLISGFAGIMYVARINAADANLGVTYHFDAISVALIGGAIMSGGSGSIWGVAAGAVIISVIQSGMNNMQVPTELQTAFLGVLIIVAVCFNTFLQKKKIQNTERHITDLAGKTVKGGAQA
ncbi:MAG: ABC transporter permease [Spirochaetia bacterium]|jgi:ribose/xylose/arabinose/galactoside ABC-type transport system permease subunit|nr:ABC transporter permease [Spirochaetia bacterium]